MTVDTEQAALCACFNLRKASRSLTSFYDEQLRELGITTPQFTILMMIEELGESRITPLADELVVDRTTLTRNLDRLKEEGLVQSRPGKEDARTTVISLTDEGAEILERAYPKWKEVQKEVVDGLGEETFMQLIDILNRVPDVVGE